MNERFSLDGGYIGKFYLKLILDSSILVDFAFRFMFLWRGQKSLNFLLYLYKLLSKGSKNKVLNLKSGCSIFVLIYL